MRSGPRLRATLDEVSDAVTEQPDAQPSGLCTGVGWHERQLELELLGADGTKSTWELLSGRELAVRLSSERRCIGSRPPGATSLIPCPNKASGLSGSQCEDCFAAAVILPCLRCDGERCRNPARREICVQPANHALYLCAFAGGVVKVGVARWDRRWARVCEQSARAGLIVARADGQIIRRYEQMIRKSGIPDRLSPSEKLSALAGEETVHELEGELERRLASIKKRLPIPWMSEPETLKLAVIPPLGRPRLLSAPGAASLRGRIAAMAGNIIVLASDRGEELAIEAQSLVGYELAPLEDGEQTAGQMAMGAFA